MRQAPVPTKPQRTVSLRSLRPSVRAPVHMIAIAFHRMIERSRCSIARSPLLFSSRSGGMVLQ
jgi:hypothetical protein